MTKIDIFSGFLGAGKTTLIKKLIKEAYNGEKIVLVENEFGEIGVDGAFMQDAGIEVTEMNSGCICCSLSGDFSAALQMVVDQYHPDRILIEPSGVGKLSDVVYAVEKAGIADMSINGLTTVADAKKCRIYMKNFGEFYVNQLEHSSCIVLSRTAGMNAAKLDEAIALIRSCNANAVIVTTPWDQLNGAQILEAMERRDTLDLAIEKLAAEGALNDDEDEDEHEHEHHHDGDDDDEHEHEHHHGDDEDDDEHEHHHDDDDDEDEHEHHHHDDEHEHAGHHHHHHHHHHGEDDHDADEIFESWGVETAKIFNLDDVKAALTALDDAEKFGAVLRAKGIIACTDSWYQFDYVPGEYELRPCSAAITGRLCVIGSELKHDAVKAVFGLN